MLPDSQSTDEKSSEEENSQLKLTTSAISLLATQLETKNSDIMSPTLLGKRKLPSDTASTLTTSSTKKKDIVST